MEFGGHFGGAQFRLILNPGMFSIGGEQIADSGGISPVFFKGKIPVMECFPEMLYNLPIVFKRGGFDSWPGT